MPVARHLDPAAALAFRTPLQEHFLSADGKAAGILTLLGIMFTTLARFGPYLGDALHAGPAIRAVCLLLLAGFAACALGTVVQAFRTISPRFPKVPPSLAFFADIARLSRDEYVRSVEALTPDAALDQMLAYNHTAATICVAKFRQLRPGLRLFEIAALCWLLLLIILAYRAMR